MVSQDQPSFADRLASLTSQLAVQDSPLALGLWERGTAVRIGEITRAIKGVSKQVRRIEDGYQYVGGFPAHMWKLATADVQYKTLFYGITTFSRRWNQIRSKVNSRMHYVSIGPGTGEKDAAVLSHLETMADDPLVYIPVDVSADLLRMSLDTSLQNTTDRVDVLPIELDIASERGLQGLKEVIRVMTNGPVLISLLGNTLANFRDDRDMLARIATLLARPDDMLLIELATTRAASEELATAAGSEYDGSVSFRHFVMAALTQYTNCTSESGDVVHQGRVVDHAIEVATLFIARENLAIYVNDTDHFTLPAEGTIELYRSRKYTDEALKDLLRAFNDVEKATTPYSRDFGVLTSLLRFGPNGKENWMHPAARMGKHER